jgi:hypothetical protein
MAITMTWRVGSGFDAFHPAKGELVNSGVSMRRPVVALAALSLGGLAVPAAASADKLTLPSLTVPIPAKGHATAEVFTIKETQSNAGKIHFPFEANTNERSLPKSVRVFTAVRSTGTSSSHTFSVFVVAVNKGKAKSAGAAGVGSAAAGLVRFGRFTITSRLHSLQLHFTKPARGNSAVVGHGHAVAHDVFCTGCRGEATAEGVQNVDVADVAGIAPLVTQLNDAFGSGLNAGTFFHYDNGHAFKFKSKGIRKALKGVADDLVKQKIVDVMSTLSSALGTKLT